MVDEPDVQRWIEEARQGSREAMDRLLDLCRSYLLQVADEQVGAALRVKMSPADLVQDTLLEAHLGFDRFEGSTEEELRGWLRTTLFHNLDSLRRSFETDKRQLTRELQDRGPANDRLARTQDSVESPSAHTQAQERDEPLERALQQLPEDSRRVLLLHEWDGLTFAAIGLQMGCSVEAVRATWRRALDELQTLLERPDE
jgi:RNA polymerase sigma-70 factor (ECF subfamily)